MIELRRRQTERVAQQAAQHGAVFIEHGHVAVLEQVRLRNRQPFARHLLALDSATQHPEHAAVAVIRAAVAAAEGAAKFADHDDDGIAPLAAHFLRKRGQATPQLIEAPRQVAGGTALPHMRIPAPTSTKPMLYLSFIKGSGCAALPVQSPWY